jgi:hypothetical protein
VRILFVLPGTTKVLTFGGCARKIGSEGTIIAMAELPIPPRQEPLMGILAGVQTKSVELCSESAQI